MSDAAGPPRSGPATDPVVHWPSYRLNSRLFALFLALSLILGLGLPDRYPVHFGVTGDPTRWAEGPGMWILLVAICAFSFGKLHLIQRYVASDPASTLINVPHKRKFLKLPRERRIPVFRRVNRMLGFVNGATVLTFTLVLLLIFFSARYPGSSAASVASGSLLAVLAIVIAVPLIETAALSRMIRTKLEEEGLADRD